MFSFYHSTRWDNWKQLQVLARKVRAYFPNPWCLVIRWETSKNFLLEIYHLKYASVFRNSFMQNFESSAMKQPSPIKTQSIIRRWEL